MMESRSGNAVAVLISTLVVALLLGFAVGSFSASSRARVALHAAEALASGIPPSPVVTAARYDRDAGELVLRVFNPGLVPVKLIEQSLVFKPSTASKETAYALAATPLGLDLAPLTQIEAHLMLKPGSEELVVGDAISATVAYAHPYSNDLYTLTHLFTVTPEAAKGKEVPASKQPQMNTPKEQMNTPKEGGK
ncbi:MAG TPA: hypothetical protein EYP16_05260 [Candidatus Atribacteria bacterium]|nr:hypothetical protein [Candidatus Atribacteria bacterium]